MELARKVFILTRGELPLCKDQSPKTLASKLVKIGLDPLLGCNINLNARHHD